MNILKKNKTMVRRVTERQGCYFRLIFLRDPSEAAIRADLRMKCRKPHINIFGGVF